MGGKTTSFSSQEELFPIWGKQCWERHEQSWVEWSGNLHIFSLFQLLTESFACSWSLDFGTTSQFLVKYFFFFLQLLGMISVGLWRSVFAPVIWIFNSSMVLGNQKIFKPTNYCWHFSANYCHSFRWLCCSIHECMYHSLVFDDFL